MGAERELTVMHDSDLCWLCPQGKKDYIGLAIKNDNLVYVYNLGGEYVEIPVASKPVSQWPAVFNYIRVER